MADSSLWTPVPPGGAVRFRVVDEVGLASASWRVWTTRTTDDVYVAGRQSAGWTKVSLHASGVWQHGVVKERTSELGVHPDDRLFARWTHHPERVTGWTLAVLIAVPHEELRAPHEQSDATKIREIPALGHGRAVVVEVWLEAPGMTTVLRVDDAVPVGVLKRAGGGGVWVVARAADLPWDPRIRCADQVRDATAQLLIAGWDGQESMRIVAFDLDAPTGTLMFCELALDPPVPPCR